MQKPWAVQIYTSHEFDVKEAFTSAHMSNLKQIFEGKGGMVSTNKHVRYERLMKDGLFLISSNELPMAAEYDHAMHNTEWKPFLVRCELIRMIKSWSGLTEFPYDAPVLASALSHLVTQS